MSPRRARVALTVLALGLACSSEAVAPVKGGAPYAPPPESCDPVDAETPRAFTPCSRGSGSFGTWVLDERGLPAYEYGLDENADARASFFNTEGLDRRDHWAAFGNARVNGMFFNDGYVEVVNQDRGVEYLDKYDETQGAYAGGFSYVDDGAETWCTAYKFRPPGAETRRRFGMGYGEAITSYRDISVTRRVFAPKGDAAVVIDEVAVQNLGASPRTLRHYEYFDVGRRPIEINWVVSGSAIDTIPADARKARDARNAFFDERVTYDAAKAMLTLTRSHAAGVIAPPAAEPNATDYYPGHPFLAELVGEPSDTFTDQGAFFGAGGAAAPRVVIERDAGEGTATGTRGSTENGLGQPRMFVIASDLSLAAGETRRLRFAYGKSAWDDAPAIEEGLRNPTRDLLAEYESDLAPKLVHFTTDDEPTLHREVAWHAYQLEASVGRRDYFEVPFVPQGSAYLYLHGADGVARDLGIFTLPLVYSDPALARNELELYMRIQFAADHRFTYAFQGHGVLDDALGLHTAPSDLDIFFFWALSEYLGATGDLAFFDAQVPFWPKEATPGAIAFDHVEAAARHLFDVVGTGEHGLVRVGTGDWSDGITVESPNRQLTIEKGESVPNTQMAAVVLPRMADLVEPRNPALAAEMRSRADAYRAALASAWGSGFYGRAYFGDGKLVRGDRVNLEAQVWALIGDEFASESDRASVIEAVRGQLDEPSPAGAELQPDGAVWPAISGLLTEGYARTRPNLAWPHYKRNTLFAHALAYPDTWFGIWSGPDGLNGPAQDRPGGSWFSVVTPMTDFPVQNNNQHAMPLFATLRIAGVVATPRGLRVEPKVPSSFSLATWLVDVASAPGALSVTYRPTGSARREVELVAPEGEVVKAATSDGVPVHLVGVPTSVTFDVQPEHGKSFALAISTGAP